MKFFTYKKQTCHSYIFDIPEMIALAEPNTKLLEFLIYIHFYENGYLGFRRKIPINVKIRKFDYRVLSNREGYFIKCDIDVWFLVLNKSNDVLIKHHNRLSKVIAVYDPFSGEYFKLINRGHVKSSIKKGYRFFKKRTLIYLS